MRKLALIAAVAALAVPALAYAASFGLADGGLGAGAAAVGSCDAGFSIAYTTSGGDVTAVTVGDIADPACEGGRLSVTVVDAGGVGIAGGGPVTIPADGDASPNAVVVPVSGAPAAEAAANVKLLLVGP